MWLNIFLMIFSGTLVLSMAARFYGKVRWNRLTQGLKQRLESSRRAVKPALFEGREIEGLPAPVQRYFRAVLKDGSPMVAAVDAAHSGRFNVSDTGEQWKRFSSTQSIVTRQAGFVWDGCISMMPGLAVRVHDAYLAGEGLLFATLLGMSTLADLHGRSEIARAELMRYLAEAAWYPTALLPSQGVRWEAVDASSARATLEDDYGVSVTLLFRFAGQGLIESVRAEDRGRIVDGSIVPTPWEGRWWNYQERGGMLVPFEGEVAWMPPEGKRPYWRGRLTRIEYEFAS